MAYRLLGAIAIGTQIFSFLYWGMAFLLFFGARGVTLALRYPALVRATTDVGL